MGDDGGKSPQEGVGDVVQALQKHLPNLVSAITGTYDTAGKAEVDLARKYSPEIAKIQADVLGKEGKDLARIGREISTDEQRAAADVEAEIAGGAGQKITESTRKAAETLDPEFYKTAPLLSASMAKLLDFDPNKLSRGEEESVARGLGRTSTFVPSAMETAKGAMTFGDALTKRRANYGNAVTQAAAGMPALKSGINPAETTSRRAVLPNAGLSAYTGIQSPGLQAANNASSGLLGTGTTAMNINMQKELSDWDKYQKGLKATTDTIGSVVQIAGMAMGCWVARTVYGVEDPRWIMFRGWLMTRSPLWLQSLYVNHGERFAAWLGNKPRAKRSVRFFMNIIVNNFATTL